MKLSRSLALAITLVLTISASGLAQPAAKSTAPPFSLVSITTITVKPSAVAEFEAFVKNINAGAVKIGISPTNVYSMGRGGPAFTYVTTVRFPKWADIDDRPSPIQILFQAYGDDSVKMANAGLASIESTSTVVVRVLPKLSSAPSLANPFAHVRLTKVVVKQGSGARFEAYVAKLKAAQDKVGGFPGAIRYVNVLGPGNTYLGAYFFNKFAQWDSVPSTSDTFKKAFGEAEAKILEAAANDCIVSTDVYVLDYRADLTLAPAPAAK